MSPVNKLLLTVVGIAALAFGGGYGVGNAVPVSHKASLGVTQYGDKVVDASGFTQGELELMNSQISIVEAAGLDHVTAKPLFVIEVKNDRLAYFAINGDGTCNDNQVYAFSELGAIEHKKNLPDSVGPVRADNAIAFAGTDGEGACK